MAGLGHHGAARRGGRGLLGPRRPEAFHLGVRECRRVHGQDRNPGPLLAAVVVTLVEFVGGLALVLGLYAQYAAALLAIDMLVAILTVHLWGGFFLPNGIEFALSLFAANTALLLLGSGEASVDGIFRGPSA